MDAGELSELRALVEDGGPGLNESNELNLVLNSTGIEDHIRACLVMSLGRLDWSAFERYVVLAARRPSAAYTDALCRSLDMQSIEFSNGDVVTALGESADSAAVDCLVRALWWDREWDEYYQLARNCLWALARIGSGEAVDAIGDAAETGPAEVRKWALYELSKLQG